MTLMLRSSIVVIAYLAAGFSQVKEQGDEYLLASPSFWKSIERGSGTRMRNMTDDYIRTIRLKEHHSVLLLGER
jgi:hypothetical protein